MLIFSLPPFFFHLWARIFNFTSTKLSEALWVNFLQRLFEIFIFIMWWKSAIFSYISLGKVEMVENELLLIGVRMSEKLIRKQRCLQDILQGLGGKGRDGSWAAQLSQLSSTPLCHTQVIPQPVVVLSLSFPNAEGRAPLMTPKPCKIAHLLIPFSFSLLALFILPRTGSSLFLCSPWFMPQNPHLFCPPCILLLLLLWWILFIKVLYRLKDTLLFNFFILRKNSWSQDLCFIVGF